MFNRKGVNILVKTSEINLFKLFIKFNPTLPKKNSVWAPYTWIMWLDIATDRSATDQGFAMYT